MRRAIISPEAREAVSLHLAGLGLPAESRSGLLSAVEKGLASGEPDSIVLWDRLLSQSTDAFASAVSRVADEIADVVLAPVETLGGRA